MAREREPTESVSDTSEQNPSAPPSWRRRNLPWLPTAVFLFGAILATWYGVVRIQSYERADAKVVGIVYPVQRRATFPRELYEVTMPDGRVVQAYGGVVGTTAALGTIKRVYYDPEASYAEVYGENEAGEPNTSPVYTTIVAVILVPSVLWISTLVLFGLTRLILTVRREDLGERTE